MRSTGILLAAFTMRHSLAPAPFGALAMAKRGLRLAARALQESQGDRREISPDLATAKRGDGSIPRFYRRATVEQRPGDERWRVLLDDKALRTPQQRPFLLPTFELAQGESFFPFSV